MIIKQKIIDQRRQLAQEKMTRKKRAEAYDSDQEYSVSSSESDGYQQIILYFYR